MLKTNQHGHFGKMCFTKTVAMISEDITDPNDDTQADTYLLFIYLFALQHKC